MLGGEPNTPKGPPEQPSDDGAQELARRAPTVIEGGRHPAAAIPRYHRGLHQVLIRDTSVIRESRNHAGRTQPCGCRWARQDSNLGPTDYESAALTAELRALRR
jgi:hypothetical protein